MADHGEWVECVQQPSQFALPQEICTCISVAPSGGLGVPVMQSVAGLLTVIVEHKGDLKVSSINKVLRMWLSHNQ